MGYFSEKAISLTEADYQKLGIDPDVYLPTNNQPKDEKMPIAVDLKERQLALTAIMSCFNELGHISGLTSEAASEKLNKQYGNRTPFVIEGAVRKGRHLEKQISQQVDILIAKSALEDNGFSNEAVSDKHSEFEGSIYQKFGPDNAYAKDRAKFLKKISR